MALIGSFQMSAECDVKEHKMMTSEGVCVCVCVCVMRASYAYNYLIQ